MVILGCIYDTIMLLSTRSRTSLHKGKHISLSNHTNTKREGDGGAGGVLLTSDIVRDMQVGYEYMRLRE